jgi:probable F420-dependent oxidoreductase
MKIGVVYPQTEYASDPEAIRVYARTAEALGYTHVLAYDHILGANPERPGGWQGPYTYRDPFQEPFALFSYMAALTEKLSFITGIVILPQRETALAAKQAATLDVLSGGRLRLGIGIGWNKVEYVAMNQNFHTRGKRVEAQIDLLRRLWTEPLVTVDDQWHHIDDAGLNPLPVQQPIPIWIGGYADVVLQRVARMGDGWLPGARTAEDAAESLAKLDRFLAEAGRSRADIGLEPRIHYGSGDGDEWRRLMDGWRAAGATHLSIDTMRCGFAAPEDHLRALERFAAAIGMA